MALKQKKKNILLKLEVQIIILENLAYFMHLHIFIKKILLTVQNYYFFQIILHNIIFLIIIMKYTIDIFIPILKMI